MMDRAVNSIRLRDTLIPEKEQLLLWIKLKEKIRFNLQHGGNVENHLQRKRPNHIRCFNAAKVLTADADTLRDLLLRQSLTLAEIGDCIADIPVSVIVIER